MVSEEGVCHQGQSSQQMRNVFVYMINCMVCDVHPIREKKVCSTYRRQPKPRSLCQSTMADFREWPLSSNVCQIQAEAEQNLQSNRATFAEARNHILEPEVWNKVCMDQLEDKVEALETEKDSSRRTFMWPKSGVTTWRRCM